MMKLERLAMGCVVAGAMIAGIGSARADCKDLPSWDDLHRALKQAVFDETSGLNNHMWGTIVDLSGKVCAVAFSGQDFTDQWLGSRVISAQKANTANAFSLGPSASNGSGQPTGLALSTANLYTAVQPGQSLFGLQESNPVDPSVAYAGLEGQFGTAKDPLGAKRVGGINVFGGGLGLYRGGDKVGGVGVSGDTSCADHMIGWRVRFYLGLDQLSGVGGVAGDPARPDNIIYDIVDDANGHPVSTSGFGHPRCLNTADPRKLPPVR